MMTEPTANPWTRSVIRWAGSKRRIMKELMSVAPSSFARYVEPFAGSASLFFALRPKEALLADFNADLIEALEQLRHHPFRLRRAVAALPNTRDAYYSTRSEPRPESSFERAVRFVYLNRLCYNGIYRTNRRGDFNVPYGSFAGSLPSEGDFYRCSVALRKATLSAQDFTDTLMSVRAGDFVYVDPPYSTTRPTFGEYGYGSFHDNRLDDLIRLLENAQAAGSFVLLSYADDDRIRSALPGWSFARLPVQRSVSGATGARATSYELLASNALNLTPLE